MKSELSPLARPLIVADLPVRGRDVTVEANPEERAIIAREFNLVSVERLTGRYHVRRTAAGAKVTGKVQARIRQTCVVSLEAFDADIDEPVELAFAAAVKVREPFSSEGGVISLSLDEEDPPEPLVDGKVDLGAITLEFLALGLDPYPRRPGVDLSGEFTPPSEAKERPPSPFSALAGYRRKPGEND